MEYASKGTSYAGLGLGIAGTALSLMNNGSLGGLLGGNTNANYVTKDEMALQNQLAVKDSEIALLKAEQDSEVKMTEVYKQAHAEVAALRDSTAETFKEMQNEINQNRREQDAWNGVQAVNNAQISAAIAVNTNSIASLQNTLGSLTKCVIPNSSVCPGWGTVSVIPTGGTTIGTTIS